MAGMIILGSSAVAQKSVDGVRVWSQQQSTRVVIETTGTFTYKADRAINPDRLFFDITGARVRLQRRGIATVPVGDRLLRQIRVAQWQPGVIRVVFDLTVPVDYAASQLTNPDRLIVEIRPEGAPPPEVSLVPSTTTTTKRMPVREREVAASVPGPKFRPPAPTPKEPPPRPVLVSSPPIVRETFDVAAIGDPTHARERASRAVAKATPAAIPHNGSEPPSLTRV